MFWARILCKKQLNDAIIESYELTGELASVASDKAEYASKGKILATPLPSISSEKGKMRAIPMAGRILESSGSQQLNLFPDRGNGLV